MPKVKIVKKLTDKGFPTHSKYYETAHRYASKVEKKDFPKGYEKLKKKEHGLKKHELMAKSTKSGTVEIEQKFKKDKRELTKHERVENRKIRKLENRK